MSNSQQGYNWMKSFVFLEARDGKKARAHLVAKLSLLLPQLGAEFERTLCVIPVNGNIFHACFII